MQRRFEVTSPEGKRFEIEVPDDASDEQVAAVARQITGKGSDYPVAETAPKQALADPADPETALLGDIGQGVSELGTGFAQGAANVADHAADWLKSGLNAAGDLVGGGQWGDAIDNGQRLSANFGEAAPGYEFTRGVGRFSGEAVATAPLGLLRAGGVANAAIQGGIGGALLSNETDPLAITKDAAVGALAGQGASTLLRGAGGLAAPALPADIATLRQAGIRTTPGQYGRAADTPLGRFVARTEDRQTGLPFTGNAIEAGRDRAADDFARATVNRSVEPIGLELPANIQSGRRAVRWAGDQLSDAYDQLLPNLSVQGDQQLAADLATIQQEATTLAPGRADQFNRILTDLNRFWRPGNVMDGQSLKRVEQRLGDRVRRLSTANDADQQDLGSLLESLQDALREATARQNPAAAERLRAINRGWKSLTQVERASGNSRGVVTPSGYSQSVRQSSDTARRRGYARGEALNQDLSDAASNVLPSSTGSSGTSERQQASSLFANLTGLALIPGYGAVQGANTALTRDTLISPQLRRLLEQSALAAPIAAPAAIDQLR